MALSANHRLAYFDTSDSNRFPTTPQLRIENIPNALITAAKMASNQMWVSSTDLNATVGSPVIVAAGATARHPGLAFDAAAVESADTTILIPAGWATVNVTLYWVQNVAGVGDVRWRCDRGAWADAVTLSHTSGGVVTSTADSQYVVQTATMYTGLAVTAGPLTFGIVRMATDGADTLPNDALVLGLLLDRAS